MHEDFKFPLKLGDHPKASHMCYEQSVTQNKEQKSEDSKNRGNGYTDDLDIQRSGYQDRLGAVPEV